MASIEKEVAKKVDPDAYNEAVEAADLIDIKLVKSSFEVEPAFFMAEHDGVRMSCACDSGSAHYMAGDKRIIATFNMEAGAKIGRKWVLRAKATYLIAFEVCQGNPTDEAAAAYAARVGKFACYPYFRAHFAELCSGAGAEMPPLPVLKGSLPKRITGGNE